MVSADITCSNLQGNIYEEASVNSKNHFKELKHHPMLMFQISTLY